MFQTIVRFRSSFLLLFLLPLLAGCEFKEIEVQGVESVNVESIKQGSLKGTMNVSLFNPNSMSVKVKAATFEIFAGSVKLGDAKLDKSFKINGNSTETYPVKLSGNLGNTLAGGLVGLAGMLSGNNPKITLKGEVKAGTLFVSKKFPVEIATELPMDELMKGGR